MNVRLIAYRKQEVNSSAESTFELDLQEEPNISLNFKFSDIKNPETRKSNYSQTFKLPFTQRNNDFFQNWYNVNHSTLVYDTKKKFNASLYVGTVPQFEGFLQLKGVYLKAGYYDVVLMSNTADLFSAIGEKKLRDVFLNEDGTFSEELNHEFTKDQMVDSWNGGSTAFQNTAGDSLQDSVAGVQKVMYPLSVTKKNFYFQQGSNQYLDMYDPYDTDFYPNTVVDSFPYMVPITQFRPALQLKEMIRLIIVRAGFSYTSAFIDGTYFGKLFMTTCNHLADGTTPTEESSSADMSGSMQVGNNVQWGYIGDSQMIIGDCVDLDPIKVVANDLGLLDTGCWDNVEDVFTKLHPTQTQLLVRHRIAYNKIKDCDDADMCFDIYLQGGEYDGDDWVPNLDIIYDEIIGVGINDYYSYAHWFDITNVPIGLSFQIMIRPRNIEEIGGGGPSAYIRFGNPYTFGPDDDWDSLIQCTWLNYSSDVYGGNINIPMCIDPAISQKGFLKDIIQRFNLIILSDPDDSSNLIIEPYTTYLAQSSLKDWTNKLDTSKEVIIKDTTSLQKKFVKFSDLEDEDLWNKTIKEETPQYNVYGNINIEITSNDFAKGELKNDPIFSPYINEKVYVNEDTAIPPDLTNMAVQYEYSYTQSEDGGFEIVSANTKPKLFYYNGEDTAVKQGSTTMTYYLHNSDSSGGAITTFGFLSYPVCTPFEVTPDSVAPDYQFTLSQTTKSLYWNSSPPVAGDLEVFNYSLSIGSWFDNTLYGLYWKPYLDNIYSSEARIMEAYMNLNEVDIFNFKFNDEIFIKDTYWRILDISNYQVGEKSSTKVTFLKVIDTLQNCNDCDYVVGQVDGENLAWGIYLYWCPESNPNCVPVLTFSDVTGILTQEECCECQGGTWMSYGGYAGLGVCFADSGSLPIKLYDQYSPKSMLGIGTLKNFISNKIGGKNKPFTTGIDTSKYSRSILPQQGNDMIIKYNVKRKQIPQLQGESHRFVLTGYTEGSTKGYAYPEGNSNSPLLRIPTNTNSVIRVKGTATVVGGFNATYPLGYTEAFAYYTGFKMLVGGATQIGTAGGEVEFQLREGSIVTSCTLYIDISNGELRFGLNDSQTDTKRIWNLSVELDINRIHNMSLGYGENWALYQNGQNIQFEAGGFLVWN